MTIATAGAVVTTSLWLTLLQVLYA
jgi:hypothetical protein